MISLLVQALDVIDSHPLLVDTHNKSLIITGISVDESAGSDSAAETMEKNDKSKFFCNGLDLEWFVHAGDSNNNPNTESIVNNNEGSSDDVSAKQKGKSSSNPKSKMIESFCSQVLARILTLPFQTIAAINGHCIGAGLFIALACDHRIMRTKRGYIQWPEARLGMRLTKGFAELTKAKVTEPKVLREAVLMAKRYTPSEAGACGIIDGEYPMEELYAVAFQLAREGLPESSVMKLEYFDPKSYSEVKMEMYTDAYRALKFGCVEDLPYSRI